MTGIITAQGLGLLDASLNVSGQRGLGPSGEQAVVNAATGNLILQRRDEILTGVGVNAQALRTYNSLGAMDGDNNDGWRLGAYRRVDFNAADNTITRTAADGHQSVYTWNAAGYFESTDGKGAYDRMTRDTGTGEITWTDGSTQIQETYGADGFLKQITDRDGHATQFHFNNGLLAKIASDTQTIEFNYEGNLLKDVLIRTYDNDNPNTEELYQRTSYTYDNQNRLESVRVDLTPDVSDDNALYVTEYGYDGDSTRVNRITQSNGQVVAITYTSDFKVESVTDSAGHSQTFTYHNGYTDVQDEQGRVTSIYFNANGDLTQVIEPTNEQGQRPTTQYTYDVHGNLETLTNPLSETLTFEYDARGNLIFERDASGNVVERRYNNDNLLIAETVYAKAATEAYDPN
ncbi:DUF6531 domain-containing protein, partial [Pleionea sp. CnH1-48]|uniref:DUF6531 domain-containing protein n=1 Tax=Pleionea sp. CnH1-48 TaxID=2954494 RepID=UPI00209851EE